MAEKQRTVAKPISLTGKGLHSGIEVQVTINPAPVNHGYQFKRTDLEGTPLIRAVAEHVKITDRSTTIVDKDASITTVEHLLAALYGMGIDNALMEINGPEVPIIDGSAKPFAEAIKKAGSVEQEADRVYFSIRHKIHYRDEAKGIELIAYPDDEFSIDVHIDYNSRVLGHQYASMKNISEFESGFSACRTFAFLHEIEFLQKNNLIKGGDLDNAIIIIDRPVTQEEIDRLAVVFNKPTMKVKPEGILNNVDLAFANEPARHKLLDVIGDLALCGVRLKGKIIANKPGHGSNVEFAKLLRQEIKLSHNKPQPPDYDPDKTPLYDINQIQKILPHRHPFLLVDKITFMDKWTITGIKNVTMNEAFFVGHFPEEPIMPGVLQIEALAQVGGVLLLSYVTDPENYLIYFMKIDTVRFKRKVVPGDTLNIRMILLEPIKRGIALCKGEGYVGDNVVIEAAFMAQLAKKPGV
ncbi:MAG TPA: bifunctional UDP-3-O-[3-hydroxymyristoyl] N-acetylglucosamine deacetylase/3-hydroxyacyl-ACP dehydratase [Bacteroidales bacterium]|jgi:UDP-3-O-[3-hydroxymyristoyl] N-acetylglucosamine deacetylase/3-hydroxyacyl-[acyl-carrier-protein] dehydratase|nr:bifunctional UDP-3-O-[3-hydroxymyristoyl] N-acetylglucosamine deacetylase/3-hydroxyacyl-ACP dehydratase [Bacteroidales bacterium]